ncbi:MAG: hypothetical protein KatS3mg111_1990 [Pirellulaceae bacterium]|nr:MAG: hypothetical protein KatS3mg111_1990 [Pirellulaceae bacterium]
MSHDPDAAEIQAQPLLPQVRMIWFFVVTLLIAAGLTLIQVSDRGSALVNALMFTCLFLVAFGTLSALTFVIAFSLGALERAVVPPEERVESPFAHDRLPPQVLPPSSPPTESN